MQKLKNLGKILATLLVFTFLNPIAHAYWVKSETLGLELEQPFLGLMSIDVTPYSSAELSGLSSNSYYDISKLNGLKVSKILSQEQAKLMINKPIISVTTSQTGDIFIHNYKRQGIAQGHNIYSDVFSYPAPEKIQNHNITEPANTIFSKYNEFYKIDTENLKVTYKGYDKKAIKKLKKEEKEKYKQLDKIEKLIKKRKYTEALQLDSTHLPIYLYMFQNSISSKYYGNTLFALQYFEKFNKTIQAFNPNELNYKLGILYYLYNQDELALEYLRPYAEYTKNTPNQVLAFVLGNIHFNAKNYSTSIFYFDQIEGISKYYSIALENIYKAYKTLNNKPKAKEYLIRLSDVKPSYELFLELAKNYSNNSSEKLQFAQNATKYKQTYEIYNIIAEIEQTKIDTIAKKIGMYYERPIWKQYYKKIVPYTHNIYFYQNNFFDATNECINEFSGKQLKKCFSTVKSDFDELVDEIKIRYYADLDYERQKSLQDDLIREQRSMIRNY